LKFEAEGREFAKMLRSQEQFIQTVKGQNIFLKQNASLTYSWRFLRSITRTIGIKNWKKYLGFRKLEKGLECNFIEVGMFGFSRSAVLQQMTKAAEQFSQAKFAWQLQEAFWGKIILKLHLNFSIYNYEFMSHTS
jgi:hypothetical protein